VVSSGEEGLAEFLKARFDLVVTDICMPDKDGIELIIEMRHLYPRVPILAISGTQSRKTLLQIANVFEADATLQKPFTQQELLSAVEELLRKKNICEIAEER
jgi:DNA-binding response OmpR family regulator